MLLITKTLQSILPYCTVNPLFELLRKETEDQVHSTAHQLYRRLAEACTPSCVASKVIIKSSMVRKRRVGVIDLQEACNEVRLPIY